MEKMSIESGDAMREASVPMVSIMRGGEQDAAHQGIACLVDSSGKVLWSLGDPGAQAFFRSCAKPIQAMALLESGAADAAGLDDSDLAIICGSHAGGPDQVSLVDSILKKSRLTSSDLGCGDGLADMCSGKHAGMLTACSHLGLPLDTYLEEKHPWQKRVLTGIREYCRYDAPEIPHALDGCSAPTHSLPLYNMALGFARLAAQAAVPGHAARLLRAMSGNPGGHTGEPDLRTFHSGGFPVPEASPDLPVPPTGGSSTFSLVTKGGANGLLCAALPGLSLGFALKIADGAAFPRWPVFIRALEQAGFISSSTAQAMGEALSPRITSRRGEIAGRIRLDF